MLSGHASGGLIEIDLVSEVALGSIGWILRACLPTEHDVQQEHASRRAFHDKALPFGIAA